MEWVLPTMGREVRSVTFGLACPSHCEITFSGIPAGVSQ